MDKFYVDTCLIDSRVEEYGFDFDSVSDAISYISSGLDYLHKHANGEFPDDPRYEDGCRFWLDCMRKAVDCIDLYV